MLNAVRFFFLEDFSGSGNRLINFYDAFRRHRTVQSWLSYGLVRVHVVVFAMTVKAEARLKRCFGDERVHYHQICPTFATKSWNARELAAVEALCRKYHRSGNFVSPYGFLESRALMAFSHSVPNNIPPILWQRSGPTKKPWSSFFVEKAVPVELEPLFGNATPEERANETLARLGQLRMATGGWHEVAEGDTAGVMLLLAALARRPRSLTKVLELTGLPSAQIVRTLAACRRWGLVGSSLRLTDAGLRELAHAKTIPLREEIADLRGSEEPYYPRSLRVGR
ncbi:hypothetical protein V1294_006699 [Bradyrhizobium sp. AZCC 1678]|uniref:phosphoribosyltransferase-like protein n=1 Tax=Bradyrhizobium sp. AZCC 1678 TaxID=3117030 RepID=UPI002FF13BFA